MNKKRIGGTNTNQCEAIPTAARSAVRALALLLAFTAVPALAQTPQTFFEHDANGNRTKVTDSLGHVTQHSYDALNRLTQTTDPAGGQVRYQYDALGRLTQVTDPRGLATTYTYNAFGELTQLASPDAGTTTYTYDEAGNLKTRTDARGKVLTYSYDAKNRLTQIATAEGNHAFTYDEGANGKGRLTTLMSPMSKVQWAYDVQGRVIIKRMSLGNFSFTLTYVYDTSGRLTSITYPSGRRIDYHYDAQGRVSGLDVDGMPMLTNIAYFPFGAPQSWTWGNTTAMVRGFDTNGRLASHSLGPGIRNLAYDAASRITQVDEGTPATARAYAYDTLDRLTGYTAPTTNQGYAYDANGNRINLTVGAANYPYANSPSSNRLNQVAGPTAKTYTYDAAGNITGDGSLTYLYNAQGRLANVKVGTVTHTFYYNGLGQRAAKFNGQNYGWALYAYDEAGRLVGEYDQQSMAAANPLQETVYLGNTPVLLLKPRSGEVTIGTSTYGQAIVQGTWNYASTVLGYQGWNYLWQAPGTGTNSVTWSPTISTARTYQIYAHWVADPANAPDATYTIYHASGNATVSVDQRTRGGESVYLGTYTLGADSAQRKIVLTDQASGNVVANTIRLVPTDGAPEAYFVHADQLDTPRLITDTLDRIRWRWDSDPFGTTPPDENPSTLGAFTYNPRFPGQYYDAETGLHYNYFRDYDPGTGRYIQSDPIGLAGGMNTYGNTE